jgi:transposase
MKIKLYCGLDLHSSSTYIGIMNEKFERVFKKRVPNELALIQERLKPFKRYLEGIAVESTYNWYWLVDGLKSLGYKVYLANPAAMERLYDGCKFQDDKYSSFRLAESLALGNLRTGYIYPKEERPIRDLFRKRLFLVNKRTSHILSLKSLIERITGMHVRSDALMKYKYEDLKQVLKNEYFLLRAMTDVRCIEVLTTQIKTIEKQVRQRCRLKEPFHYLLTVAGIGDILAMTIMLEVGTLSRFQTAGDFSSYARCVPARKESAGKKKGEGNRKNGNKYLSWAFAEAGYHARVNYEPIKKYYQRKQSKRNAAVASRAISCKLSKASFFVMRDRIKFDLKKLFC